ncbi:hypothetical protein [Stenotrophomonas sp. G4]|uniref:hypothetical protein n=1 Tax=Stenotrophomonas sp. G4 TaxID=2303750 RepID=UPI0019676C96|nr:hypothetical protein [Stenotrophomonas sp. G4]
MTTDKTPATLATAKHGGCVKLKDFPSPGGQGDALELLEAYDQAVEDLSAERSDGWNEDNRRPQLEADVAELRAELIAALAARQPVEVSEGVFRAAASRQTASAESNATAEALIAAARQPVGEQGEGDDFLAGICVALQCVTAQDCGVLWREIVVAVGIDDLLQYATFIEPEEWELAGFGKYASAELGRRKPRRKSSKQCKALTAQAVDLGAVRVLTDHATGRINHANNGLCPDQVEGHDTRAPHCPVCRALIDSQAVGNG